MGMVIIKLPPHAQRPHKRIEGRLRTNGGGCLRVFLTRANDFMYSIQMLHVILVVSELFPICILPLHVSPPSTCWLWYPITRSSLHFDPSGSRGMLIR